MAAGFLVVIGIEDAGVGGYAAVRSDLRLQGADGGIQSHEGLLACLSLQNGDGGNTGLGGGNGQDAYRHKGEEHQKRQRRNQGEAVLLLSEDFAGMWSRSIFHTLDDLLIEYTPGAPRVKENQLARG